MTTTKLSVLNDVMADLGYPTTDTDTREVLAAAFDDTLSKILGVAWDWPHRREIRTLAVSTGAGYTDSSLDADVEQVHEMRIQGSRQLLMYAPVEDLFRTSVDLTQTGTPTRWYYTEWDVTNGKAKFKLWPIPTEDITLEMLVDLGAPTPLANSDTIPAPEAVIGVLKDGVRARAYYNDSDSENGLIYEQKFAEGLNQLKSKIGSMRAETPYVMRMDGDLRASSSLRYWPRVPDSIPYNET